MKKKIIALLLVLTLLSGTCAYAVPLDLWNGDDRVVGIFANDNVEIEGFDMLQELISYIGVADKESISGENDVKATVILRALCEITGIKLSQEADNKTMLDHLKSAKYLRSDAKASLLSLQDLLYAAARITGWAEPADNDGTVYANAKKAGLLTNITYSTGRNLTRSEAAQLIYNILAVNQKVASEYSPTYVSLNKEITEPILQSKYGIVLKEGIVTSLFGETVYNTNKIKENEIEVDSKIYKLSDTVVTEGLVGRRVGFFVEEENNLVLFAEPTTDNNVHVINFGEHPSFKSDIIEYETNAGDEYEVEVNSATKIIYNGLLAGNYSAQLMSSYFSESTNITAVDNDNDGIYDYLFAKNWETFVVDSGAGSEGVFSFAYDRTYNGSSTFDVLPDDNTIHVTILKNGEAADYTAITDSSIVAISATANSTGHRYVTIETGYELITGALNASYGNIYVIDEVEYPVASEYLNLQKTHYDVNTPALGQTYSFYVDITGRIINANVSNEYTYGYLVSISTSRSSIDASYTFKIFTQKGKMEEYAVAEKVKVYDGQNQAGQTITPEALAQRIIDAGENGDYRCLLQYKLKSGELSDVWFALDNTEASEYGKTGYQFTYDKSNPSYVYYEAGLISFDSKDNSYGQSYWGKDTILFAIPTDKDVPDAKYEIKPVAYNGSRWTEPTDFYCVDDWNIIEAAVMHMSPEAGIDNYSPVYVVDRVVSAINPLNGESCYRVYGYDNAVEKSILIGEDVVADPGKSNWGDGAKLKATDLKFGDLIQVSEVDGQADSFRLVYRHDPTKPDFEISNTGVGVTAGQIEIKTGTYGGRRGTMFRFIQTIDGVTTGKIKTFTASTSANVVDLTSGKVTKTSLADVSIGDKLVMHTKWGAMVRTYIYR